MFNPPCRFCGNPVFAGPDEAIAKVEITMSDSTGFWTTLPIHSWCAKSLQVNSTRVKVSLA